MSTAVVDKLGTTTDWKAQLPEDVRNDPSLTDIKDISGLAKSFVSTMKMVGSSLRMPAPDSKQDEWDGFYTKLGRPDKPEAYQITRPGMPDNVAYDEGFEAMIRSSGHAAGLTQRQIQRIVDDHSKLSVNNAVETEKTYKADTEQAIAGLKQKWGGSYERNVSLALSAIEKFGGQALKDELNKTGIGNHPVLVQAFAQIGDKLLEDPMVTGTSVSMQDEKTALEKEKQELYKGPLASRVQNHEYRNAVDRLTAINRRLVEIEGE